MKRRLETRRLAECMVVLAVLVFCEWFFFRNVIGTGTGALIGDRGDGRLTTLLTEHWWRFFTGKERFSEIAMFHPAKEVIGYTDLLLGFGLIHSLFRLLGVNMFFAYKWTLVLVHGMGTLSAYYLMRKKLQCAPLWALFGTIAFSFSDTYARHLGHTQLAAMSALPILLIFLIGFIESFENRKKRNLYAYSLIVWFVLLTYNSWYVACLTGIFSLIFLVIFFIELKMESVRIFPVLKKKVLFIWKDLIGYMIFAMVLYLPFIKIYLPALKISSGYSYSSCVPFIPEFVDLINVTESNWMLGKVIEKIGLSNSMEVTVGFSVVLLLLFLTMFMKNKRRNSNNQINVSETNVFGKVLVDSIFISVIVCILLSIRLSGNAVSLWAIVYYVLPVAKSMRAVGRFWLWLSFPMVVITAYCANKYINPKKGGKLAIPICAVALIFVSNINKTGVYQHWNYPEEMSFLSSVSVPPEDAEVFYIIDTANTGDAPFIYQLDAFEIATLYSLKTINGYSGKLPLEWGGIWDVGSENYEVGVSKWIERYNLSNVYAYDRATDTWIKK